MKIAEIESQKDPRAALATYRDGLAVLGTLPPAEQAAVATRRVQGGLERRIADCLWELRDVEGSLAGYRRAVDLFAGLAAADPANARAQFDLAVVLNSAGEAYEASGDLASALRSYGQVADTLERLVKESPDNLSWRAHLAEILVRIGGLLEKTGQRAEAVRQCARGLAIAKQIGAVAEAPPAELVRAARLLVFSTIERLREPELAAKYAARAVEITRGGDAYALDTLAEAYLQQGNHQAARTAIDKGLAASPAPWVQRLLEEKLKRAAN